MMPLETAPAPQSPGVLKLFALTAKPIWILLSRAGMVLPMWQTSHFMPLVVTCTACAPAFAGETPKIPAAGLTRPVPVPNAVAVGGLPWQESQPPSGKKPVLWAWQVKQSDRLL
jgi:hypothetical protein